MSFLNEITNCKDKRIFFLRDCPHFVKHERKEVNFIHQYCKLNKCIIYQILLDKKPFEQRIKIEC